MTDSARNRRYTRRSKKLSKIFTFDPSQDLRWAQFLERRADASVFHTHGWIEALRRTYGYEPVVYTSTPPGRDLSDGLLFCRVHTWLSQRRLISVPFSDHAACLMEDGDAVRGLFSSLEDEVAARDCRYIEIRPTGPLANLLPEIRETAQFIWHRLSLEKSPSALYSSFDKDCVQRKIRRAEREHLTYAEGHSEELLGQFYQLLLLTHRRHGVPPQPIAWFRNLIACLGSDIKIRVAYKDGIAVASIVTLTYKRSMVYKYGCSDARYHRLGGVPFLMWRAIQDAKNLSLEEFDLGRSDLDNLGLVRFKDEWDAQRSTLTYWGFPRRVRPDPDGWDVKAAKRIMANLPTFALPTIGELLYKHMG